MIQFFGKHIILISTLSLRSSTERHHAFHDLCIHQGVISKHCGNISKRPYSFLPSAYMLIIGVGSPFLGSLFISPASQGYSGTRWLELHFSSSLNSLDPLLPFLHLIVLHILIPRVGRFCKSTPLYKHIRFGRSRRKIHQDRSWWHWCGCCYLLQGSAWEHGDVKRRESGHGLGMNPRPCRLRHFGDGKYHKVMLNGRAEWTSGPNRCEDKTSV